MRAEPSEVTKSEGLLGIRQNSSTTLSKAPTTDLEELVELSPDGAVDRPVRDAVHPDPVRRQLTGVRLRGNEKVSTDTNSD